MRRLLALLIVLPMLGCATVERPDIDERLRPMGGSSDRDLLGAMGRIPDNSYQLDDDTKVLQWRWDTSYISPGTPAMYQRMGRMWMPMGGFPPTLVREGCIVEWTVTKGSAQSYRWQGNGCRSITL